ncbi:MAG: hypothetical protein SGARI_004817 [Bacillariaceae sp.]
MISNLKQVFEHFSQAIVLETMNAALLSPRHCWCLLILDNISGFGPILLLHVECVMSWAIIFDIHFTVAVLMVSWVIIVVDIQFTAVSLDIIVRIQMLGIERYACLLEAVVVAISFSGAIFF